MLDPTTGVDYESCRICMSNKKSLCPLFKYKLSGNYAEMLTAIADVKVCSNDGLPEKICYKCCTALEKAYLLKTVAERSDRKQRLLVAKANEKMPTKKIAFDSFTDIKSEIGPLTIKPEPKWEMEIDIENKNSTPLEPIEGRDIIIADTVIRKVDSSSDLNSSNENKSYDADTEFLEDDIFHDDDDDDYLPPVEKTKIKFKKPTLADIKVFKAKKPVVRKVKVIKQYKQQLIEDEDSNDEYFGDMKAKTTTITCYPISKNGVRGPPVLLRRPKDLTVLKIHKNYKTKIEPKDRPPRSNSTLRRVKNAKGVLKEREKLVCPICGILTFSLGNHIATHEEKKKFTCSECPRSFVQKSNLLVHLKKHNGIKDHICEVCGAGFYTQKSLARHNLIHKGDRPFPCNLCSKKFIARCDLNRHLRIHAGYKPFKCGTCAMSFNAKHQLQNHERMHTGERPYSCQICNVAFSYKVNLNNHVYKVHGINLKFKSIHTVTEESIQSIHTVTEEVLRRELGLAGEAAVAQILPHLDRLTDVPTPAAHETVHHTTDYTV